MARPREFDTDAVLDAAMCAFWRQGYEATSMADLVAATGLQKGSLYKAFTDKHTLFIRALQRYLEQANRFNHQLLSQLDSPKVGVQHWFQTLVESYGTYADHRGCFSVNCLIELAPHDDEVRQILAAQTVYLRSLLTQAIAHGQTVGDFRTDMEAEDLSMMLLSLLYGIVTSSKGGVPIEQLQKQIRVAIALME